MFDALRVSSDFDALYRRDTAPDMDAGVCAFEASPTSNMQNSVLGYAMVTPARCSHRALPPTGAPQSLLEILL